MYVYKNFGYSFSHSATAQSQQGQYVSKEDLQPGDLVFFADYETMEGIGHCGIYIGEGNFIHASSGTGYCVKISTLTSGSYLNRYVTARRII
jgi:N-acetylmuramoyl-L-alanine amidase